MIHGAFHGLSGLARALPNPVNKFVLLAFVELMIVIRSFWFWSLEKLQCFLMGAWALKRRVRYGVLPYQTFCLSSLD